MSELAGGVETANGRGSPPQFGTDGIRGLVGGDISPDFILKLGWAVGSTFFREGYSTVLIGKDTRISGYMLESALEAGFIAAGIDVRLLGPIPTPGVAYLTRKFKGQFGAVISASHNGYSDNGVKFFSNYGAKLPKHLEQAIEYELNKPMRTMPSERLGKASRFSGAQERYIEFCESTVPSEFDLRGLRVVVDCANGAAYDIAPRVFQELGAEVHCLGVEPDGFNINLNCGSTDTRALCAAVGEHQADFGVALDGDGDRIAMVDADGRVFDGDDLLYGIAGYKFNGNGGPGGGDRCGVVGTLMSNLGLERALARQGIGFARTEVGDKYVIEELVRRNWLLGGEPSGHIICRDCTTTGDAIISSLQFVAAMLDRGCTLGELLRDLDKFPQAQVNVEVGDKQAVAISDKLARAVCEIESELGDRGRVLLRPSGTESLIRVMVEGESERQVWDLAHGLAGVVSEVA